MLLTELSRVHKPPEGGVSSLEFVVRVSGAGNELFKYPAQDVCNNLNEKLADEDGLWPEVLRNKQGCR